MADTKKPANYLEPLLKQKILIGFSLFGLIVPLVVLPFIWLGDGSWGSWVLGAIGLFWVTFIGTMAIHGELPIFDLIYFFSNLILFNILFYLFLGWLFWLGKSKSKWFYGLSAGIWLFPWGFIYVRDWYYLLTM